MRERERDPVTDRVDRVPIPGGTELEDRAFRNWLEPHTDNVCSADPNGFMTSHDHVDARPDDEDQNRGNDPRGLPHALPLTSYFVVRRRRPPGASNPGRERPHRGGWRSCDALAFGH